MNNISTAARLPCPHFQPLQSELGTEVTMPFTVTADDVTSEGFLLKWTKASGSSSYLVSLEDEGTSWELCYILSGTQRQHYVDCPIKAGQKYIAKVKAYIETAIGQPGTNCGLVPPIQFGYRLL